MDFLIGGLAGAGATVFTNPMDVVKTRMQLQGEMRARNGTSTYRGVISAMYVIAKNDGVLALQKGLVPAVVLGFSLNSVRLGLFHTVEDHGWTRNKDDGLVLSKAVFWSFASGVLSGFAANPASVIKTRIQSRAHPSIAVGRQHKYKGSWDGCSQIYRTEGLRGFYAGVCATCMRIGVGSAAQLSSYTTFKHFLMTKGDFANSPVKLAFVSSLGAGVVCVLVECPLDVANTRLYNQGLQADGKPMYNGLLDCLAKIYKAEGIHGLYKGIGPFYLRIAPHTTISLVIWDMLNDLLIKSKTKSFCDFYFTPFTANNTNKKGLK